MTVIERYSNVFSFFKVDKSLIIIKREQNKSEQISYLLNTQKEINTLYLRHSGNYLYDFEIDKIIIYDSDFNHLYNIIQKGINTSNTSIEFICKENIIISQSLWDDNDNIKSYYTYYENLKKKKEGFYCGKFLTNSFRINFIYEEKYNPKYFRLSDFLDTKTYFEYNCNLDEEINGDIILYEEKLIFYTKEIEKELYDSEFWINVLDIKTGKIIYKIQVDHYGAFFDSEKGQFVSIQGTSQNNEIIKRYEIVNVNNGIVEKDNFNFDQNMFAVGTAVQYVDNNKLYFADNVYSYVEQKRKAPKIGCFDILTKQIIFFEELKNAEGFSINQIINHENKVYVKTDNNEVFILEI